MENNWKPEVGETYWFVGSVLTPACDTNDDCHIDNEIINSGNCFKTKEEAWAMCDRFKAILKERCLTSEESVDDLHLLPEWCKNAEYLYDRNAGEYACITDTNDSEVILVYNGDTEPITRSAKYIVDYCEEAKCMPLSSEELRDLVGKVLTHSDGDVSIVTDFRPRDCGVARVYFNEDWYTAAELVNSDWRESNYKCGKFTTER